MPSATNRTKSTARRQAELPPQTSSGYLVRDAHRAFQRLLERRIAAYGVSRGQWYFLRVLWITDGLSQRELSARVGMMEPTTVIALRSMERAGLIRRVRGDDDRRKMRVYLSAKAKRLRNELLARGSGHHRYRRTRNRAARSRLVPPGDCANDSEFGLDRALEHHPENWKPVFEKDEAAMERLGHDPVQLDRIIVYPAGPSSGRRALCRCGPMAERRREAQCHNTGVCLMKRLILRRTTESRWAMRPRHVAPLL